MRGKDRRGGLVIATLFVAVAVLAGLFFLAGQRAGASLTTKGELKRMVRLAAARQELLADQAEQILSLISKLPQIKQMDSRSCNETIRGLIINQNRFLNFGVIRPDGTVLCSSLAVPPDLNLGDRTYFRQAMESGRFSVGEYQIGRITNRASINFGYPLKHDDERVLGVVFLALDLSWLHEFSAAADLPPTAQFVITDNYGRTLVRYPEMGSGGFAPEISFTPEKIEIIETGLGAVEAKNTAGETVYVVAAPIKLANQEGYLHIFLSIPKRSVSK
jgi:C4-dicarboxylate-specific signal transduction histidine kinase